MPYPCARYSDPDLHLISLSWVPSSNTIALKNKIQTLKPLGVTTFKQLWIRFLKLVKTFINAYEVITDFHLSLNTVPPRTAPCYLWRHWSGADHLHEGPFWGMPQPCHRLAWNLTILLQICVYSVVFVPRYLILKNISEVWPVEQPSAGPPVYSSLRGSFRVPLQAVPRGEPVSEGEDKALLYLCFLSLNQNEKFICFLKSNSN